MHSPLEDLRYAFRILGRNPAATLVIVLSLAVGIGANTAVFSVVDALLLRPLSYPEPDRLAAIWLHSPGIGIFRDWPSPGQYIDLQNESHSFEQMALAQTRNFTLTGMEQPERIDGMRTQSALLRMFGAKPLLGRLLTPEEDKPGKPPVAILSYRLWRRLFNSDPHVVGETITMNGNAVAVVGVLRPEFSVSAEVMPPEGPIDQVDVFMPLPLGADAVQRRGDENYNIVVRLKPGVTVRQAQADIDVIATRIRIKDKRDRTFGMHIVGLQEQVVGDVRRALLVLLGSVALVLLIACANVANLLLTRSAAREKEIAIRTAMGANWRRLARHLLTESLVVSLLGGAAGLAIAKWGLYVLRSMNPGSIPRLGEIHIDGAVLAFTFGISALTGVLFGLAPVWRAVRLDVNRSLKAGGRSGRSEGGILATGRQFRGLLVISELALSLMLLTGAGLLIRSFVRPQSVTPGFSTDHILSMRVAASGPKYRSDPNVVRLFQEIQQRVGRLPGVVGTGLVNPLPLAGSIGWGQINVEGYHPAPGQELQVDLRIASPGYFRSMDIPLVQGRHFSDHDNAEAAKVTIIDAKFAQRFWPRGDAVGKHLWFDHPDKPYTIVGVVGVVKQYSLDVDGKIVCYFATLQETSNDMYLVARSNSDPPGLAGAIRREVHAAEPDAVVYDVRTMHDRLRDSMARQRFSSTMLGAFALFALLLAAVGVYGVMSDLVSQSTHDIGVRMALGAQPGNILYLIVSQGMRLAAIGIGLGLVGAAALTRVIASLLFGVGARDAVTFGSVGLIMAAVAFAATVVPARHAMAVDPVVSLREE